MHPPYCVPRSYLGEVEEKGDGGRGQGLFLGGQMNVSFLWARNLSMSVSAHIPSLLKS